MKPIKINDGIYWVGAIDWDVRNFHGYITQRGATYNAYLIIDEKITLIDTVKPQFFDEMIKRISHIVDPAKIDYIISNHVEMDHSGSLPQLMEFASNATVIASPKGKEGLQSHYNGAWKFEVMKSGDILNLGKRSIEFLLTPMLHWPDNMIGYLKPEKILFSNDAFGQHLASSERFDHELPIAIVLEETKKYYGNIILPFGNQVTKAIEAAEALDIEVIAPSHGVIWKKHISDILSIYKKWCKNNTESKAVIVYDTMWNSTEKIAYAIQSAFEAKGISTKMRNLKTNHISDIMTDITDAKFICVGSPTLNNNMLPTVAGLLTYLKGLVPKNRIGMAFGSYGWSGQSIDQVEDALKSCRFDLMEKIKTQYIPDQASIEEIAANTVKTQMHK
ncbi:flavorubredoxin [Desulfitispora alkaliphila]|uniref:FprA family A-type flavoprotein n=1 Tax=Desulfitispora alkaliphila TaxID=622674 RepID=UPI003D257836